MSTSETRSASEALAWMQAQKKSDRKMLFRGQTKVYCTIGPSITRKDYDQQTQNEMWSICHDFFYACGKGGVTGYAIENAHDRLSILQHYIRRSPVIDLTGTPRVALYFAILGAEIGQECVVYSIDRSQAEASGVVFSDHPFFILPLEEGGLQHRWVKQNGYSVGPEDWSDSSKVEEFDLLKLDGVSCMCFEKGPDDEKLVAELGDLESLDDDPLASKVRGVVTSIVRSHGVYSPGIQKILENSKTRDPHGERTAEIDCMIARAKKVNAPPKLIQTLEKLKRASEGISWETSHDATLYWVKKRLSNLSRTKGGHGMSASKEFWAIIALGVTILGLGWQAYSRVETRLDVVQQELAYIKGLIEGRSREGAASE